MFQGQTADGVTISKTLTFTGNSYPIQFDVAVQSAAGTAPVPEVFLTDKSDHTVVNPGAPFEGFVALVDNKIKREAAVDASKGHEFSGDVAWAGFGHTYFFFALMPDNGAGHKVSVRQNGAALVASLSGQAAAGRYRLFIGPKELELLKSVGKDIDRAIDHRLFRLRLGAAALCAALFSSLHRQLWPRHHHFDGADQTAHVAIDA